MDSQISNILAEIFIHDIKQTHILNQDNNKYAHKIIYCYRYLNDIILLFNGNNKQTKLLVQYIIKLHPKLNSTLETKVNSSINFLDLIITKTIHTCSIYLENPPP